MNTLKVAILDDEKVSADLIESVVAGVFKQKNIAAETTVFTSAKKFMWEIENKDYNLLFLDIDMPELDGVELGNQLRKAGNKIDIIFVSNREDRVFDTMKISPVCFVRKSHILTDTPDAVDIYLEKQKSLEQTLVVKSGDAIATFKANSIVYIEGERNTQEIFLDDGQVVNIRSTMQDLEKELVPLGFIRIHKGYLVNADNISLIDGCNLKLRDGRVLPISRRKLQEVKEKYLMIMKGRNRLVL